MTVGVVDSKKIMKALDWGYALALDPRVPMVESAQALAAEYSASDAPLDAQVDALIRWQDTKAATAGFLAGLGGAASLPVSLPASVGGVLFLQTRMVAAIAIMGGHDPRSDRVRALVYACLCGKAAHDLIKQVGIDMGKRVTMAAVQRLSCDALRKINERVGFQLVTKFGERGVISLGKAVPLVGGLIGGAMDAAATHTVGTVARRVFLA